MTAITYRGYEFTARSLMGGINIAKDGEYVDHVLGDVEQAKVLVDEIEGER